VIRISTRGRYALRAIVDLARHTDGTPVPRHGIADRQNISSDYVAQLFRELAEAGLVEGVKGPGGGYRLARPAAAITAEDVVVAVEGPIALTECVVPEHDSPCNRADGCVTRLLWKRLSEAMTEILRSVTLADLVKQADQIEELEPEAVGI
jgi:Rrf2 family cysteine metabolism transcriptional repressor